MKKLKAIVLCGALVFLLDGLDYSTEKSNTFCTMFGHAIAQTSDDEEIEDPRPERDIQPMKNELFEQMSKFEEAMEEEPSDLEKARAVLDRILERSRRFNPTELAIVHRAYTRVAWELDEVDLTLYHLEKIIEYRDNIYYFFEENALYRISQIYYQEKEDLETALSYIMRWYELAIKHSANELAYISTIHLQLENYQQAIDWIKQSIAKYEEQNLEVKEQWWRILLSSYNSLENYEEVLNLSDYLVHRYPLNKDYWMTLSIAYSQLDMIAESSYAIEGAYMLDMLDTELRLVNYTRRLAGQDASIRAAWVMEAGFAAEKIERNFDNLSIYGQYTYRARFIEKTIQAYEDAIALRQDPDLIGRLARIYQESELFNKCISTVDLWFSLDRTSEERNSQDYQSLSEELLLTKGVCQLFNDQFNDAKDTLTDVKDMTANSEDTDSERRNDTAASYLKFVDYKLDFLRHQQDVERAWADYHDSKKSG